MKKLTAMGLTLGLVLGIAPFAFALNANVGVDVQTSLDAEETLEVNGETSVETETTVEANEENEATENEGVGITITRESAAEMNADVMIASSAEVKNSNDLSIFAAGVVKADANAENVELSENVVSLRYKQRARLFGVFPVFVYANAVVEGNGNAKVDYPWYGFFLSQKERVQLESNIEAAVKADVEANAKLSSSTQARILEKMRLAMKNSLDAAIALEAEAKANAKVE